MLPAVPSSRTRRFRACLLSVEGAVPTFPGVVMEMVMDGEDAAPPNPCVPQPRALRCSPRDPSSCTHPAPAQTGTPGGDTAGFRGWGRRGKRAWAGFALCKCIFKGICLFFSATSLREFFFPWGNVPLEMCSAPGVRRQQCEMPDPTAP